MARRNSLPYIFIVGVVATVLFAYLYGAMVEPLAAGITSTSTWNTNQTSAGYGATGRKWAVAWVDWLPGVFIVGLVLTVFIASRKGL